MAGGRLLKYSSNAALSLNATEDVWQHGRCRLALAAHIERVGHVAIDAPRFNVHLVVRDQVETLLPPPSGVVSW